MPALLGLLGGSSLISLRYIGIGAAFGLVLVDLAYVALGVGLMLRKELARQIYVVIAVIGIVFAVIGTAGYVQDHGLSATTAGAPTAAYFQQRIAQTEARVAQVGSETNMTPAARSATLAALRAQLTIEQLDYANSRGVGGAYGGLVFAWLLALGPLVLLTRPAVKSRFS